MTTATALDSTLESQSLYTHALEKIRRNRFRDALNDLIQALRIAPSNANYLSYFGLCLAQTERDYDRAVRVCLQALETQPKDPLLRVNLGKVYRLKGDKASAHAEFIRAWNVKNRHPAAAAELTRMGIRRPSFFPFLPRQNVANKYLGILRAMLERKLIGHRQS